MGLAAVANLAWWAACTPETMRFGRALRDPAATQERLLRGYLRRSAATAYGRAHGFGGIRTVEEYRERVPVVTWDDLVRYVERIAAGEGSVLTADPVRVLEPSGGSTAAAKLIPYTRGLQREFARAVAPWVWELFRSDPRLAGGPAYWSVTPVARKDDEEPGRAVQVGFAEDAEYLGGALARLAGAALAVPAEVRKIPDVEAFRYVTLAFLLACRGLRLLSVWHPSFLELLLGALGTHWDPLLRDLAEGRLRPPGGLPREVAGPLGSRFRAAPGRARALAALGPGETTRIWPRLRLVSCWADGHAALGLPALQRLLPGVRIQPKGLLATEAFVTLPWAGQHVLAVCSHFFEFLDDAGRARLVQELREGETYSVVVTTGGGLYRYRLEDRVEVTGFAGGTPALRFLGKEGHLSDRFGEKLSEGFVAGVLGQALRGVEARFALLAPEAGPGGTGYALFLEAGDPVPPDLAQRLEAGLRANPHYAYCRDLDQLRPARVRRVGPGAYLVYARRRAAAGQRLGDVKPTALSPESGWGETFGPEVPDRPAA